MVEYPKPWASIETQISILKQYGLLITNDESCAQTLRTIGYYRFTGYLYPFRESETYFSHEKQRELVKVLENYRTGAKDEDGLALIEFDRRLRLIVLAGVEKIELALRTQIGYVTGKQSTFAQLDPSIFVQSFTDKGSGTGESKHDEWLRRIHERQNGSHEAFVEHFRNNYDNKMPIWALVEIMELGQISKMYQGLNNSLAIEISNYFGVPNKKTLASWIASINYVRNVAAHHARLFNRKLQDSVSRPKIGQVPVLDHLRSEESTKQKFGVYNTLAVMAFLIRKINPESIWHLEVAELFRDFPNSTGLTVECLGAHPYWEEQELWKSAS